MIAVYALGRRSSLAPRGAALAAALFGAMPVCLLQATTNYVDLISAGWLLSAVVALWHYEATGSRAGARIQRRRRRSARGHESVDTHVVRGDCRGADVGHLPRGPDRARRRIDAAVLFAAPMLDLGCVLVRSRLDRAEQSRFTRIRSARSGGRSSTARSKSAGTAGRRSSPIRSRPCVSACGIRDSGRSMAASAFCSGDSRCRPSRCSWFGSRRIRARVRCPACCCSRCCRLVWRRSSSSDTPTCSSSRASSSSSARRSSSATRHSWTKRADDSRAPARRCAPWRSSRSARRCC